MKKIPFSTQIIMCLVAILLTNCTSKSPESITQPQYMEVTSFPSTLKNDNVIVEFSEYRQVQDYLIMVICFAPPNKENWTLDNIVFKIENQEIQVFWDSFDSESKGRTDGFSCGRITYPIDSIPDTGKAELSIGSLRTGIPEYSCEKVQKKLDEEDTGIVIMCGLGDIGIYDSGIGIMKKPETMNEDVAFNLVVDAFYDIVQINFKFLFFFQKPCLFSQPACPT